MPQIPNVEQGELSVISNTGTPSGTRPGTLRKWRWDRVLFAVPFFVIGFLGGPVVTNNRALAASDVSRSDLPVDAIAPAKPTIFTKQITGKARPVLRGTWEEKADNTLKVVVAGKIFSLGRDKQLASDGKGNWTLTLTEPLSDGNYVILAESSDASGNLSRSSPSAMILVDKTRPDPPTIKKLSTRSRTPALVGTWPQTEKDTAKDNQNSLRLDLDGKVYLLGKDSELTSDGTGNWSLTPSGQLADGEYDVVAIVTDPAGNKSVAESTRALIIDTRPPKTPTVTTILTRSRLPTITGTWDSSDAVELRVSVAGQKFSNAKQGEIEIDGDHWSLQPAMPIADGTYDVVVATGDILGNRSSDAGRDELVIDGTSPPTPTVRPVFGTSVRPPIGGTWPQDGQNSLSVALAGKVYSLSKGGSLTSDGKGNWKLVLGEDLHPGSYDVMVKVADRLGNQSRDVSVGEIWIKAEKQTEPPAITAPPKTEKETKKEIKKEQESKSAKACQKTIAAVLAGQNIGFKSGRASIDKASQALIARLAEIARTCPQTRIEVSGHTDSRGSASYNQSLSEARASAVVEALVLRGVAKNRLRAVGYGEARPIANNATRSGRAKNRRIEFRLQQ